MFVLVLGGARSGKSRIAERLGRQAGAPVVFVATATAGDEEMTERIRAHRMSRPLDWSTVEESLDPAAAVGLVDDSSFVIVDCLTLWVSNLLGVGASGADILEAADAFAVRMKQRPGDGVVVSNEVGWGIVPDNELARRYRDILGTVNATFAEHARRSLLMVAGRALELNGMDDV